MEDVWGCKFDLGGQRDVAMPFYIYSALTLCWVGLPLLCLFVKKDMFVLSGNSNTLKRTKTSEFELEDEEKDQLLLS